MSSQFKYELLDLSNTHNAIADWLIANPGKGQLGKCAAVFGYTQSWLSTLIHQDAFQALLKHKQGQTFQEVIIPLHEKMSGVAHRGVEKLGEIIEETKDERLVREVTKDMLAGLGYGASRTGSPVVINNNTQNNLTVNADALAAARERRSQHYGAQALESPSEPQGPSPESQAIELPASEVVEVGETRDIRTVHADSAPAVYGDEEEGREVRGAGTVVPD